jgi:hypothetical protein
VRIKIMKLKYTGPLAMILILILSIEQLHSDGGIRNKKNSLMKVSGVPSTTHFNINNISTLISNDGTCDDNLNPNLEGLIYPKGTGKTAVFESGFVWGGKVNGQIRVGGSTYLSGLQAGKIIQKGQAQDQLDPSARIFRVRHDFATADLSSEINDAEGTESQIREQYQKDWNEWPAADGAPYKDIDGDGTYNPSVDVPGVPGADVTIFYIANDLDSSKTKGLYGSPPVGLELHVTVWGYKQLAPLDNMIFKRYQVINKSDTDYTDAYFGIFSDVDDGNASDDVDGCDTILNLGYTYNLKPDDSNYNPLPPPAVGFALLQGPIVNGNFYDTAEFNGRTIYGKKNLPMTSFGYIFKNDPFPFSDPTLGGEYKGTIEMYNLLHGKVLDGQYIPVPIELGGGTTKFPYSGDPINGTGFLDTRGFDHRLMVNSGPFNIAPGDTQEVVFAEILAGAFGKINNITAVKLLKSFAANAHLFYKNNFAVPAPISAPEVKATGLNREVVLSWGSDINGINKVENSDLGSSKFEGYNVYQLPTDTSSLKNGIRIATFDLKNKIQSIIGNYIDSSSGDILTYVEQYGTDSRIQRFIGITKDTLTGKQLNNGSEYYFAVTAYSYSSAEGLFNRSFESQPKIIGIVPQSPKPGIRYEGSYGEQINVVHSQGKSDGSVSAMVVDPTILTGDTYKVTFTQVDNKIFWNLIDSTTGQIKLQNQTDQTDTAENLLIDGMKISINNPPAKGIKRYDIKGSSALTSANSLLGFENSFGAIGWASPAYLFGNGKQGVPETDLKNVLLVLAQVLDTSSYNPNFNLADTNISFGYRYGINFNLPAAKPDFGPFIINKNGGFAYQDFVKGIPLSAWDVEDTLHPRRLALGFTENNVANGLVDGKYWPPDYKQFMNVDSSSPREWLWIFNTDYSTTPNPEFEVEASSHPLPVMYFATFNRNSSFPFSEYYSGQDQIFIRAYHINTPADVFTFTAPQVYSSLDIAKLDIHLINVFPNPYYPREENPAQNFVTFSHLPQRANIRIFNLAGLLVARIYKNSDSQFQRWNLENDAGRTVADGLYIAYIELPDFGKIRILKLAVVR